jgi:hypothetical protein
LSESQPHEGKEIRDSAPGASSGGCLPRAGGAASLPLHPLLFAAFPLLVLYASNLGQVRPAELARPLGIALGATLLVWVLSLVFTRHARKSAVIATLVVGAFYSVGHLENLAPGTLKPWVMPFVIVAVLAALVPLIRSRKAMRDATRVLNVMALVAVAPSLFAIATSDPSLKRVEDKRLGGALSLEAARPPQPRQRPKAPKPPGAEDLPDIYYIVLDAYGRADRLKQIYGFDNTPFLEELKRRGFTVAAQTHSNYMQTQLCVGSTLNMRYFNSIASSLNPDRLRQMIDENAVIDYLRPKGYDYVSVWSGHTETRVESADYVFNNQPGTTAFEWQVMSLTPVGAVRRQQLARYQEHRERINGVFRGIEAAARVPSPKFVFAHAMAPHPPFVFGANGEPVDPPGMMTLADGSWLLALMSREAYRAGYVAQLQYINRQVLRTVDALLSRSKRPPIIVIQGDHGSRMNVDWDRLEHTDLRECFAVLNAVYAPASVKRRFYPAISPVNTFRVILSTLFGADLPVLPDRSYYSTASNPYAFVDVTARRNQPPAAGLIDYQAQPAEETKAAPAVPGFVP